MFECPFCGSHEAQVHQSRGPMGVTTYYDTCADCIWVGPVYTMEAQAA